MNIFNHHNLKGSERIKRLARNKDGWLAILFILAWIFLCALFLFASEGFSQTLPGSDASGQMEAAGTVLRLLDTALFQWGAKIFAGVCVMSAGWALKEQRFGMAVICIIGAIVFGTATVWVRNIFEISKSNSVFGSIFLLPLWILGSMKHGEMGDA